MSTAKHFCHGFAHLTSGEVKNPFYYRIHLTWWDKFQLCIRSITILPVRVLSCILLLLVALPIAAVCVYGQGYNQKHPFTGWRKATHPLMRFLCRACFYCVGFQTICIIGKRDETVPILVATPHTSFWDGFIAGVTNLPSIVSREENASLPFMGLLVRYIQPVFVCREDPNSRQTTIQQIQQRITPGKENWPQILIFPEGTCTNGSCLIKFKSGAFMPGVPVQPVLIRYKAKMDTTTWPCDAPSAAFLIWLTLCQFDVPVDVEFLDVYYPSNEEQNDYQLYANNVREVMARALKIPVTDHTFEDCRLMMMASKKNLPFDSGIIEYYKLSSKLGINWDNVSERLQTFSEIAHQQSGEMSIEDFAKYLHVPVSEPLKEMFSLYDRNGSGLIDFREFVIGLSLLSESTSIEDMCKLLFELYATNHKCEMSASDLSKVMYLIFHMSPGQVHSLIADDNVNNRSNITYDDFLELVLNQ